MLMENIKREMIFGYMRITLTGFSAVYLASDDCNINHSSMDRLRLPLDNMDVISFIVSGLLFV